MEKCAILGGHDRGPRYQASVTSQRSQGQSKVGAHGYDAVATGKDVASNSRAAPLSAPTPPAMRRPREADSSSKSAQDTYDYINLDHTASANTAGTAASVASGGDVAATRRDRSEPPYAGRTTNSSVDDDVEHFTSSMSATGKSDVARSDDVYLDVTRNSQSEAPDSVNDVSMTTDVTKQDDNENVYFKDNDAYQP